jgi:glycosyltransferase involved in cell wall biosynthesis
MLAPAFYAAKLAECLWGFDCEDILSEEYGEGIQDSRHQRLVRTLEDQFIPQADYVTCASLPFARWIRENYRTEAVVIRNVPSLADAPSKLNLDFGGSRPYLSLHWFSQSIGPLRGIEDAVRALPHVAVPVQLHLRGTPLPGYVSTLRQLISELGVADRVFFHERVEPEALIRSAAQHDIGLALMQPCCLNHQMAAPNKIFAYMMAGLAVVATDTEGHRSVAREAPEAILTYEPGNYLQLAERINALSNRELLQTVRESAFQLARTCFNWETEQGSLLETIAKLNTAQQRKARKDREPVPRSAAVGRLTT